MRGWIFFLFFMQSALLVPVEKKVGFYLRHVSIRGTEVSTFDYADCNETILGNESYIFLVDEYRLPKDSIDFPESVREKFQKRFQGRFYECSHFDEVEAIIQKEGIDVLYNQKAGSPDTHLSKICKNAVHAVFFLSPHGDAYASISEWLSSTNPSLNIPFVPYMVRLDRTQDTLHEELRIPRGAVVFGRHGGYGTFDVGMAREAVQEVAKGRPDWFFLFLNTCPFCQLPNVIFLPGTADMVYKTKFINTCDAMVHARSEGETFGLACAEFSIKNKPIVTWLGGDRAHIAILRDYGFYYRSKKELMRILSYLGENVQTIRQGEWDAYSERYNPESVMKKFDEVFLQ